MKSLQPIYSRTPIRKDSVIQETPIPPDIRKLTTKSYPDYQPKLQVGDKIHQKFKSEYNAFMNQLGNFVSEEQSPYGEFEERITLSPLQTLRQESSEHIGFRTLFRGSELFSLQTDPVPKVQLPNILDSCVLLPKDTDFSKEEVVILKDLYPKVLDLDRSTVQVFGHIESETDFISYKKARENTDTVLFVLGPEGFETKLETELEDFLFIAYSKKQLYEEYIILQTFGPKVLSSKGLPLYFTLDLIEEESYHIPMSHIVRILEYPHPMYLIEKANSFHVYLTRPCKL